MLISIETHMTCDFPGGWSGPLSSLWIRACEFLLENTRNNLPSYSTADLKAVRGVYHQIFAKSSVIYQMKM